MATVLRAFPSPLIDSRTLVFGGSTGIGASLASGAASQGSSVFISSSNPDKIASTVTQLQALYPAILVSGIDADLSDTPNLESSVKSVLDAAVAALGGPLDHIVFTAGNPSAGAILENTTVDTVYNHLAVRHLAPLIVAKLVAKFPGTYLKPAHTSSITLTSGILARRPRNGLAVLSTTAGAIESLAHSLAVDLKPIRVNAIVLGPVQTELMRKLAGSEEGMQRFAAATLVSRIGSPEDAAEGYLMCLRSSMVTGQSFVIDGGLSLV